MKRRLDLIAKLPNGETLAYSATTEHFLVRENGDAVKISLQKAALLYQEVKKAIAAGTCGEDALIFKQAPSSQEEEKISFAERLRKRLDLPPNDSA